MDDVVQGGPDFLLTTMMVEHLQKVIRYSFSSAMSVGDKLKNIQLIIVHHAARRKIIFVSPGETSYNSSCFLLSFAHDARA